MTAYDVVAPRSTFSPGVTRFLNRMAATLSLLTLVGGCWLFFGGIDPVGNIHDMHVCIWGIYSLLGLWLTHIVIIAANKLKPSSLLPCMSITLVAIIIVAITFPYA